jgi:hypothetical protein
MLNPDDHACFEAATIQWRTLVDIQVVHGHRMPDESKSRTETGLYVFRDEDGTVLLKFALEAPSGWNLIWDIGQGAEG